VLRLRRFKRREKERKGRKKDEIKEKRDSGRIESGENSGEILTL
jgi:hypothetical protein